MNSKKVICLALFISSLVVSTSAEAKEWTGYFQTDYTSTDNPESPKGFQLRRINLIYNKNFLENARVFADVEYENGTDISGSGGTGEIKLSRGYGEFNFSKKITLLIGKFLTPFGMYNEIHDFSATYIPVDPPSFYRKQKIFATDSAHRLLSKYSTGLMLTYKSNPLLLKFGTANGELQDSSGGDDNKSPMLFARAVYRFFNQSAVGFSYHRDKISSLTSSHWEDLFGLDLLLENEKYVFQAEYVTGKKWNRISSTENATVASYALLLGTYISDSWMIFSRYSQFIPDMDLKDAKNIEYGLGVNYYMSYYTILKWELYEDDSTVSWEPEHKHLTNKLSLSIVF